MVYYGSSPWRSLSPERFSGKLTNLSDQQVKKALERRELKEAKAQSTMDIGKMASIVEVYSSVQNNNHNKDMNKSRHFNESELMEDSITEEDMAVSSEVFSPVMAAEQQEQTIHIK